jgi:hypothetical protein
VRGASISNHLRRSSRARHAPEPASAGNFCHSMTLSGRWPQTRHESPKSKNAFPPRSCTHQARPVRPRPLPFHERTCPNSNWDGRVALTPILLSKSIPAPRFLWRDGTCQIVSRKVTVPVEVPFSAKTQKQRSYARALIFLRTSAEFFDPNAMQLQTACSTIFFLPAAGT